jgi:50S ribosomal subunit-associated GTPase HflX
VFRTVGEIPVVFAINKADLKDQASFGEEQIKLATEGFDAPWFHVSAKTGANVEGLFRALAGTIAQNALGK